MILMLELVPKVVKWWNPVFLGVSSSLVTFTTVYSPFIFLGDQRKVVLSYISGSSEEASVNRAWNAGDLQFP